MPLTKETHILIVDDDEDDFLIIADYLKEIDAPHLKVDWAPTYAKGKQEVNERKYHVYLVDYRLGAKTGLDFIKEAIESGCEEPIILLTGKGNHTVDKEAMVRGAADYLIKSELNAEKLERSIRYSLGHYGFMKAVRANERKYRNMFESSKDAVFIADLSLKLKDINQATSSLLGLPIADVIGLSLYDFLSEGGGASMKEKFEATKEVTDLEVKLLNRHQESRYCLLSASIQSDGNEEPYVQGIIHDISSLKRAERASLHAEKLAATGRLIRTLAHEVRNPLNNIQMSVEQLFDDHKNDENSLYLEIIKRNGKRINDLINELLASSRPSEMEMEKVSLQQVLDESIQAAMDRITLQQIKLNLEYPDYPCYINGDVSKLKLAFLNIIINAIEAMQETKGQLAVTIKNLTPYYTVEISDNGCGIPKEDVSKLFEPYFTSKRNGMGLGLAATLNILQSHMASIDVISHEGDGTTFSISFAVQ
jgi:PAS domain S-box-containing protein